MGLDATVYCDCFRSGNLREPPPPESHIKVAPEGYLYCDTQDMAVTMEFDRWLRDRACDHARGVFLSHFLGNISLVAHLREELSTDSKRYPLLLKRVIYDGTHSGDFIPVEDLEALRAEVLALSRHKCSDPTAVPYVEHFAKQMAELVEAALMLVKPIVF